MKESSESYGFSPSGDRLHLKSILKHLKAQKGEKVLEIGSNNGALLQKMQEQGVDAIGVEINPEAVAKKLVEEVYEMDATSLTFQDASFDKIYSLHTIEHIPDLHRAFQEMDRVLRPGGRVVLVYPAEPIRGLFVLARALVVYKNPMAARKIHLHKLTPKKVREYMEGTSLEHVESHFSLFFLQYLSVFEKK